MGESLANLLQCSKSFEANALIEQVYRCAVGRRPARFEEGGPGRPEAAEQAPRYGLGSTQPRT
jgi:hypothetical protein